MQRQYDHIFKVILIGPTSVGKTSLLKRFADNEFNQTYLSTIGIDFRFKSFYLEDKFIKLQLWDTAGQERFSNITKSYYNGSHAIVVVYDAMDDKSFEQVKSKWVKEALVYCNSKQVFVLANKCDNRFQEYIKREQQLWARQLGVNIIGVSAKTGGGVGQFFQNLTKNLMTVHPQLQPQPMRLELEQSVLKPNKKCQC